MPHLMVATAGILLLLAIVGAAFEALAPPRTATRTLRPTRLFYQTTWPAWVAVACFLARGRRRESFLAIFGPLSILILMACWATALVFGFAMIQWGLGSRFNAPTGNSGFWTDLYLSGTTLFTLGTGDVTPIGPPRGALTRVGAGPGPRCPALP